jgi:hypothetical protein
VCDSCSFFATDELPLLTPISHPANQAIPEAGHLDDLKLAASNMLSKKAMQAVEARLERELETKGIYACRPGLSRHNRIKADWIKGDRFIY